jgi:PPP family 3-phenylpropionic acid transporter
MPRVSQRFRLNGLFFFGYLMMGFQVLYLNLYLRRKGLSGAQIGTLWAIFTLAGVLLTPWIGSRFDRLGRPGGLLAGLAVGSAFFFCGYLLPVPFMLLLVFTVLLASNSNSLMPFMNSLALAEISSNPQSPGFGAYRRWGALGFAAAGVLAGLFIRFSGLWTIFPGFALSALAIALLAVLGPKQKSRAPSLSPQGRSPISTLLRSRLFVIFMLVNLLTTLGFSMGFTMRAIYLDSIGISDSHAGFLIVAPTLAEIITFSQGQNLQRYLGVRGMVFLGALLTGVRWSLLGLVRHPGLLYVTELSHAAGFPMFLLGCMEYVNRTVPQRRSATAQVLVFSSASGIGGAAGAWLSGILLDTAGPVLPLHLGAASIILAGFLHLAFLRNPKGTRRQRLAFAPAAQPPELPPASV